MLNVYLNYPNPKVSVHGNPGCGEIRKRQKVAQRLVHIDLSTISSELQRFTDEAECIFVADRTANDMWLEVDFNDLRFEEAVVAYIHRLVSKHYPPFGRVSIKRHCG